VLLHNPIGDGKADSGSAKRAASRLVHAVKTLEDSALVLLGDSNPRVAHSDYGLVIARFHTEFDDSWGRRVLNCVVEQDGQQSFHGSAICQDWKFTIRDSLIKLEITSLH
jgi:hypothetical protein